MHDALEEGKGEEVDKTEEYVSKGITIYNYKNEVCSN